MSRHLHPKVTTEMQQNPQAGSSSGIHPVAGSCVVESVCVFYDCNTRAFHRTGPIGRVDS